ITTTWARAGSALSVTDASCGRSARSAAHIVAGRERRFLTDGMASQRRDRIDGERDRPDREERDTDRRHQHVFVRDGEGFRCDQREPRSGGHRPDHDEDIADPPWPRKRRGYNGTFRPSEPEQE